MPDDLQQAAVEQVAFWFQNKDHLRLKTHWPRRRGLESFLNFEAWILEFPSGIPQRTDDQNLQPSTFNLQPASASD